MIDPLIRSIQRYSEALELLGGKVQRKVMVCDRCKKESKGDFILCPDYWAKLEQRVPGVIGGREVDICDDCVKDFDELMKNVDLIDSLRSQLDIQERRRHER